MKRILTLIITICSTYSLFAQTPITQDVEYTNRWSASNILNIPYQGTVPTSRLNKGSLRYYTSPGKLAYWDTNWQYLLSETNASLLYYNKSQVDALIASMPIFDANLYYNKTQSDGRFVSLTGSYNNPTWITGLAYSKLSGAPTLLSQFTNDLGNYGSWITKVQGDTYYYPLVGNPSNFLTSYTETDPTVPVYAKSLSSFSIIKTSTDALYPSLTGSYPNPAWITSLDYSKITNAPTVDLSNYVDKTTDQTIGGNKSFSENLLIDGITIGGSFDLGNNILGEEALKLNTSGSANIAIGLVSLSNNTTGSRNVSIGAQALNVNISGSDNTAVGNAAGLASLGSNNTYIGSNSNQSSPFNFSNSTAIGGGATVNKSNKVQLGGISIDELGVGSTIFTGINGGNTFILPPISGELALKSDIVTPNLQAVTTGAGNNVTNNALIINGINGYDADIPGLSLYSYGNGAGIKHFDASMNEIGGIEMYDGHMEIQSGGGGLKIYPSGNPGSVAGHFLGRLRIEDAITTNEAVTLGQMNTALSGIPIPDLTPLELKANKQNSLAVDGTGIKYPTVDAMNTGLGTKQNTLISGTTIKTVNGVSILGSGDISISGGGGGSVTNVSSSDANIIVATGSTTPVLTLASTISSNTTGNASSASSVPWTGVTGKPSFFSGDYNDLTNKPTIPPTISLTTTGTSGAATLSSGVLNIPQYSGGSGISLTTTGSGAATLSSGVLNIPTPNLAGKANIDGGNFFTGDQNITSGNLIARSGGNVIVNNSANDLSSRFGFVTHSYGANSVDNGYMQLTKRNSGASGVGDAVLMVHPLQTVSAIATGNFVYLPLNGSGELALKSQFDSGNFTPTVTGLTNTTTSHSNPAYWTRIGNIVTVSGRIGVTATAVGTVMLRVTVPVASAFTLDTDLAGVVTSNNIGGSISGFCIADVPNDAIRLDAYMTVSGTSMSLSYTYSYQIK